MQRPLILSLGTLVATFGCSSPQTKVDPPQAAIAPQGAPKAPAEASKPSADPLTEAQKKFDCDCRIAEFERGGTTFTPQERAGTCEEYPPKIDCVLTYFKDPDGCQALIECSRGEPGRTPNCREGYQLHAMNNCYKRCPDGSSSGCEPRMACDAETKLCMPDGTFP